VTDPHKVMAGFIVLVVGTMNMLSWRFFCNLKDMFLNGFSIVCFGIPLQGEVIMKCSLPHMASLLFVMKMMV
jgi:hypothetical protein